MENRLSDAVTVWYGPVLVVKIFPAKSVDTWAACALSSEVVTSTLRRAA